jgi:hypothetical protein
MPRGHAGHPTEDSPHDAHPAPFEHVRTTLDGHLVPEPSPAGHPLPGERLSHPASTWSALLWPLPRFLIAGTRLASEELRIPGSMPIMRRNTQP